MSKPEWLRVAEAFETSRLTQKEFSHQRCMRLSTLQSWMYWRRRQEAGKTEPVRLLPVEVAGASQPRTMQLNVVMAIGAGALRGQHRRGVRVQTRRRAGAVRR
ncbi:IS66 family insertion sequence element accessory protein TnpA [Myxococcus xanthus]|uniref:IS66 family insertion sequence element accessory protein TnpA n=1 Tax=Myxococcus xanthus TaxID=34 RepID=UPI003F67FA09